MELNKPMVTFSGTPWTFLLLQIFKILMNSDKTIHRAYKSNKYYKQNPLENFFISFDIPKLYIGFSQVLQMLKL